MVEKIEQLSREYEELIGFVSDPASSNSADYREKIKRIGEISSIVEKGKQYLVLVHKIEQLEELAQDDSLKEIVEEEYTRLTNEIQPVEEELDQYFFSCPDDKKDCIVEIRAGTGGEEASLFAKDLFRMYSKFAESKGLIIEIFDFHASELGGFKEIIFLVRGEYAYGNFKYESGVHRVQRIPDTESSGRIHTSAATVAVFPSVEEDQIKINPEDLKIETFCSSGHGGQSVNTTYSAVRITHIPTGITVRCQDERSQIQNRARAMKILRARLQDMMQNQKEQELSRKRKAQIKSGDRSEKIRTYNFPQNRLTDHRIGLTLHNLQEIMEGKLDYLIGELKKEIQNEETKV
ncbi:MAG TPA: peptide chain release factor 1 [bacterium]|nr:peptide chain release factor 1 [bacterium]HOL49077.1 peptide chain release factor 1 [bacterium]HPO52418.1 peptide chain release factor 1 [bacterium]